MTREPAKQKKRKSALTQRAEYALYRALAAPIRGASAKRVAGWGEKTGRLLPAILKKRARLVERNLALAFPHMPAEERKSIARRCWSFFAGMVFRFLHATRATSEEAAATVGFDQPELVADLIGRGRGLVVVTAHFGDWEHALHVLNQIENVPITVIVRSLDNELLDEDLYRARLRSHVELADRRSAARPLIRTLERKGIIVLLADQAVRPREGILVPFLDIPAWTTPAPAKLALRTGAPIVVAFARDGGQPLMVEIEQIIDPLLLPEDERNAESITTTLNAIISERIRRKPELWLWMHDRWKNSPAAAASRS